MAGDEPLVLHHDTGAAAMGQSGAPPAREEILPDGSLTLHI